MIKKLQALRAKKGFTLVELIVVIAIIGVLAAILIPTLTSQITKAKVTSADSTAKEILQTVNTWITENVTAGGKYPASTLTNFTISMNKGTATVTDPATNVRGADYTLAKMVESDYPAATFHATVYLSSEGKAWACAFQPDTATSLTTVPTDAQFKTGTFAWKAKNEGVTSDGSIVGTSPKLKLTT